MATAALATYDFAHPITLWFQFGLSIFLLVVEVFAFIHCATQRADAFPAVGSISKGGWLVINAAALLFTLVLGVLSFSLFGMLAVAASLVYLLDVRPALRDAVDGHGSW